MCVCSHARITLSRRERPEMRINSNKNKKIIKTMIMIRHGDDGDDEEEQENRGIKEMTVRFLNRAPL